MEIKHSVLVVTYNQEAFIEESISSLLNQTELPYEIVILDDCSRDNNWDIITRFQSENPSIVKAFRNEVNLGIFENIKKIKTLFSGNVISYCSGDDLLDVNAIKSVNDKIRMEKLNPEVEKFIIITNSAHLHPDGTLSNWDNFRERHIPAMKTRLRYGLSYRAVGFSKPLLLAVPSEQEFLDGNPEVGYNADFFKGFEEIRLADKLFYVNETGGIYRLDVGVTSVKKNKEKWTKHQSAYRLVKKIYFEKFDRKDLLFIDFIIAGDQYKIHPNFANWIKAGWLYLRNYGNFSYNNPMIRNLHYLIPHHMVEWLKYKIYPVYLRIRDKNNK
ncbi:MAG: hypothetical protein ABS44_07400 [Chryseobacterium sp. SCN 40-13]|nr:MAG: hypothetical protein ABS44_07400 [Chryseobacterium sp. SCN 40-13]